MAHFQKAFIIWILTLGRESLKKMFFLFLKSETAAETMIWICNNNWMASKADQLGYHPACFQDTYVMRRPNGKALYLTLSPSLDFITWKQLLSGWKWLFREKTFLLAWSDLTSQGPMHTILSLSFTSRHMQIHTALTQTHTHKKKQQILL